VLAARAATGAALACVYPPGMKLASSWANRNDTGLLVGLLVGGVTLGSAGPHLANALGGIDWRLTVAAASGAAVIAAGLILLVRLGPRHAGAALTSPAGGGEGLQSRRGPACAGRGAFRLISARIPGVIARG
jgi:predicted MFS family arabinose efflux permease